MRLTALPMYRLAAFMTGSLFVTSVTVAQAQKAATRSAPVKTEGVATPGATATPPATSECVPACRVGFVCARGKCVSACNPPCASNEVCSAALQCVATAPAYTSTPAYPVYPAYSAPASAGVPLAAADATSLASAEPSEPLIPDEIRLLTFVPRLGIQGGSIGAVKSSCTGSACENSGISYAYNLQTALTIGADVLLRLGNLFRIGPGLLHTLTSNASDGTNSIEAGSLTELNIVAEAIPRVTRTVWLVPRVQAGLALFTATGTTKDGLSELKGHCLSDREAAAANGTNVNCSSWGNPHIGFDLGLGFGAMLAVSRSIRLRADAMYDYFNVALGTEEASGAIDLNHKLRLSGSRFLVMGGVEF